MSKDGPFHRFLPAPLQARLWADAEPVGAVPGLRVARGLRAEFPDLLDDTSLRFVVTLWRRVRPSYVSVLDERARVRAWVDQEGARLAERNRGRDFQSAEWETVLGRADAGGNVVVGPHPGPPPGLPRVQVPPFLQGEQVTLFGPPGNARMCLHAMNSLHRVRPGEPAIVTELVAASRQVPRWGADDEDSKTPIMRDFLRAGRNLAACFDGTLKDEGRGAALTLVEEGRAHPIKRIPGLALPDGSHLLDGEPLPLHLVDFAAHLWRHRHQEEALVFYVPKLEDEGEAAYVRELIDEGEALCAELDPAFVPGRVRLLLVFESPRAIFRIREMALALGPRFLGGSLGWHDFLAATARLFRTDPGYRIPVKADPDIVIRRIQESHLILARTLSGTGALRIGGMYGVLYEDGNERSYRLSLRGFFRDVLTQLRRGLDGFWVAHPDFVRIGIALVEAWRRRERDPADRSLQALVGALFSDARDREVMERWLDREDPPSLDTNDPRYARAVLAADLGVSSVIRNDDPDEVRYNLFQAVQYLADWLGGNGCVALPASLRDDDGNAVFVRIMDDLATTERSRWEVWAEVHHGRVAREEVAAWMDDIVGFLRADQDTESRRIQVRWQGDAARWYPVATKLLVALVTTPNPPEFVTEWCLPFTFPQIREAADPWAAAVDLGLRVGVDG
jgi:malate synthase